MQTLMVIAEMGSGGAEAVVVDLASHLASLGHGVRVASNGGWRADVLAVTGVGILEVPLRASGPLSLALSVVRLARELRRTPVDVVHAHNVRATLAAHLATRLVRSRPPVLSTIHGLSDEDYARAARVLERCADAVVAVSEDVADRLRAGGLPTDRLHVVENAVPMPDLPARETARRELELPAGSWVVLCLARLILPKRQDLLIEAWGELELPAHLLLAGGGPARESLERQVIEAGLQDRITFLGDRRDVGRLLAASDVLVLPSDREGLSMTVLEAMVAGVPVVASAVGGLASLDPDVLELVEPGSATALASGVSRVLSDQDRRDTLVAGAHALVGSRFSVATMRERYEKDYSGLCRGREG